jgi:8-oxo-dGTP pyrophosphatase MutT (NUDIX family)
MTLAERLQHALAAPIRAALLVASDFPEMPGPEDGIGTPAAVLVPIVDRPDPGIILTIRTDTMRRHAGQIAFPGGRIDAEDDGPVDAALREAEEEIGLPRDKVRIVGIADRYRTITGFDVTPVLGLIPPDLDFVLQPEEVAGVFEAPLHHLLDPRRQRLQTVEWDGAKRHYYEIVWREQRIWGATAAMIVNLGRRLAPAL